MTRHFDAWFGATFAALGLFSLAVALGLWLWKRHAVRSGAEFWRLVGAPLGIGLIFAVFGGGFVLYGLTQIWTEERLAASGARAVATVTGVERTVSRLNGRYLWKVHYEYRDPSGRTRKGAGPYLQRDDAETFSVGERVSILIDPAAAATSCCPTRQGGAP